MQTEFITQNFSETKKLGKLLAKELFGGEVICLSGELGAGKTTFTQGLLSGLGAEKPYTSPTFVVMKEYKTVLSEQRAINSKEGARSRKINAIYHFDAYRVSAEDILNLGWEEIVSDSRNICIVEWAEKLEKIIPAQAIWIEFSWLDEKRRKLTIGKKDQKLAKIPKAC
jgi:tRNA threonylcarbamoyladenosine biosynthesis protein TsaE